MSLRFRLNLLITSMFLGILLAGSILAINNARNAVAQELRSTANLAMQLLEVAFLNAVTDNLGQWHLQLQNHIDTLGETRHLNIEIRQSGRVLPMLPLESDRLSRPVAPGWFVELVKPDIMEVKRVFGVPGMPSSEIVIRPDPADEITEAWKEARSLLALLFTVFIVANAIVYIGIGRLLRPIGSILTGLEGIERGEYRARLPKMRLPELARIGQKFNHMAQVLESSREDNRLLTRRTLAIQEDERRRLAQQLHDDMGQSINAIHAMAVSIKQSQTSQKTQKTASRIADISVNVYDEVRGMMRRLRPLVLDELGLIPALQDTVDAWNERNPDAFCLFNSHGDFSQLCDDLNISIYRIAQEFLSNVERHSGANRIEIALRRRPRTSMDAFAEPITELLDMQLTDNGSGFDPQREPRGLGLLGMQERVESFHGVFQLRSSPGAGVKISVGLPITNRQNSNECELN